MKKVMLVLALAMVASAAWALDMTDLFNTQATLCYARSWDGDSATIASLGVPVAKIGFGSMATGIISLDANAVWTLNGDRNLTLGPGIGMTITPLPEESPRIKLGVGWCEELGGMTYIGVGWKL